MSPVDMHIAYTLLCMVTSYMVTCIWLHGYTSLVYGYMVTWLYGYMVTWLHGYMVIWLYGYMVTQIKLYDYMVIWLYGYQIYVRGMIPA